LGDRSPITIINGSSALGQTYLEKTQQSAHWLVRAHCSSVAKQGSASAAKDSMVVHVMWAVQMQGMKVAPALNIGDVGCVSKASASASQVTLEMTVDILAPVCQERGLLPLLQ